MSKGKRASRGISALFLAGAAIGSAAGAMVAGRVWRGSKAPRMTTIPVRPHATEGETTADAREASTG